MRKNAWYKREPWRVLTSYRSLTLSEKGVANVMLDMIYMEQGPIDLDYDEIRSWCGKSNLATVTTIVDRLIARGKFHLTDDGKIDQALAAFSIERDSKSPKKSTAKSIETDSKKNPGRNKNKRLRKPKENKSSTDSERESLSINRERDSLFSESDLPQAAIERLGALAATAKTIPEHTLQALLEALVDADVDVISRRGEDWVRFKTSDAFAYGFCASNHSGELRAHNIELDRK